MKSISNKNVSVLNPHPLNRKVVTEGAEWEEFLESVGQHGVLEPLTVRAHGEGWQILSGHRRHAAAVAAGLVLVPCVVEEASDAEALWFLVNANLQRLNLSIMEEARIVNALMGELNVGWEEVAKKLSREEIWVRTRQLVFEFPEEVREALDAREEARRLSEGAFREIIRAPRELWEVATQAVLFPAGSDEPLSEQRAREEIHFSLIPEWEEKKKWEAGAEKLRKGTVKDMLKLCGKKAELAVVIAPWEGSPVIDAVDASAKVPVEYLRAEEAYGRAWVSYAAEIGLPVVVLRSEDRGGLPRAVVSRRAIMDDAAAREEHGMDWPLRGKASKSCERVKAALDVLEGEGEPMPEDAPEPVATPGGEDGIKIEQTMEHRAMIDMGAVKRVAMWAESDDSSAVQPPDYVPLWAIKLALGGQWSPIGEVCEWVKSLKG